MAHSSLLGGDPTPRQPSGTDVASLGPSDLSDTGSDMGMGALDPEALDSDSDSLGTGERATVDGRSPVSGADILPDHLERAGASDEASTDDALQHELDFDDDEWAEQGLDAQSGDVRSLAQDEASEDDAAEDDAADGGHAAGHAHPDLFTSSDPPLADRWEGSGDAGIRSRPPHPLDAARGGGPGHDIGRAG